MFGVKITKFAENLSCSQNCIFYLGFTGNKNIHLQTMRPENNSMMKQTADIKGAKSQSNNTASLKQKILRMSHKERTRLLAEEMVANLRNPDNHGKTI